MLNLEVVGEGMTTKIYRDGDRALKLYVNVPLKQVENEYRTQAFAQKSGLPVPAVYGVRAVSETETALEMDFINGVQLINSSQSNDERKEAIRTLVKLQCKVHTVDAAGLQDMYGLLKWKIENNDYIIDDIKIKLFELLESLSSENAKNTCLCHGDFHPLNILYDGENYWIIDWVDATAGDPLADACRTYLIFRQHLTRMSGIYLREFCRVAGAKKDEVLRWLPLITAVRLRERMGEKDLALLTGIVEEWYKGVSNESI